MQQLVQRQTQDQHDFRIESGYSPAREVLDEMIQTSLPAQRAGHDIGCERSIAFVVERPAAGVECGGQVGAVVVDRAKRLLRRGARRSGHDEEPTRSWHHTAMRMGHAALAAPTA